MTIAEFNILLVILIIEDIQGVEKIYGMKWSSPLMGDCPALSPLVNLGYATAYHAHFFAGIVYERILVACKDELLLKVLSLYHLD